MCVCVYISTVCLQNGILDEFAFIGKEKVRNIDTIPTKRVLIQCQILYTQMCTYTY